MGKGNQGRLLKVVVTPFQVFFLGALVAGSAFLAPSGGVRTRTIPQVEQQLGPCTWRDGA